MAHRRRKLSSMESWINVTPLADVSLSLLLAFLVITPIIYQTLSATLPQGGGVASGQVRQDPIIVLTAERKIMVNNEEVSAADLPAKLAEFFPRGTTLERKVMFTGAEELPYQEIVDLLDILKKYGVETIGIR